MSCCPICNEVIDLPGYTWPSDDMDLDNLVVKGRDFHECPLCGGLYRIVHDCRHKHYRQDGSFFYGCNEWAEEYVPSLHYAGIAHLNRMNISLGQMVRGEPMLIDASLIFIPKTKP